MARKQHRECGQPIMSDRKTLCSIANTIVALGDEAGCLLFVSSSSLAAMPRRGDVRILTASDLARRGELATSEFSTGLRCLGINHPNIGLSLALYGRLTALCSQPGAPIFEGAGKTSDEIEQFFHKQQSTLNPPTP